MSTPQQAELAEKLRAPFASERYKSFEGRGGRRFTYVDDETVMERLDDVFGPDGWDLQVQSVSQDDVAVKVAITAGGVRREDFGYPTNAGGEEPLKEAVSDGIRRVGRTFGIARDVYEGKVAPGGAPQQPRNVASAPQINAAAPQTPVTPVQVAQQVFGDEVRVPQAGDECPKHPGQRLVASKDGSGDLYHKSGEKPNGKAEWCAPYRAPRQARG